MVSKGRHAYHQHVPFRLRHSDGEDVRVARILLCESGMVDMLLGPGLCVRKRGEERREERE